MARGPVNPGAPLPPGSRRSLELGAIHAAAQGGHAAIIKHRRAGLSSAKVADKLNQAGHRTRTGGQWTRQGAHQVHQARDRAHGAAA